MNNHNQNKATANTILTVANPTTHNITNPSQPKISQNVSIQLTVATNLLQTLNQFQKNPKSFNLYPQKTSNNL